MLLYLHETKTSKISAKTKKTKTYQIFGLQLFFFFLSLNFDFQKWTFFMDVHF